MPSRNVVDPNGEGTTRRDAGQAPAFTPTLRTADGRELAYFDGTRREASFNQTTWPLESQAVGANRGYGGNGVHAPN